MPLISSVQDLLVLLGIPIVLVLVIVWLVRGAGIKVVVDKRRDDNHG